MSLCVRVAGERFYGMAADSVFRIPLWRHVYTWLGIVPASAANLRRYLKWGSVGITPGGIAEMYLAGAGRWLVAYRLISSGQWLCILCQLCAASTATDPGRAGAAGAARSYMCVRIA